jgi:hypothetical protein
VIAIDCGDGAGCPTLPAKLRDAAETTIDGGGATTARFTLIFCVVFEAPKLTTCTVPE